MRSAAEKNYDELFARAARGIKTMTPADWAQLTPEDRSLIEADLAVFVVEVRAMLHGTPRHGGIPPERFIQICRAARKPGFSIRSVTPEEIVTMNDEQKGAFDRAVIAGWDAQDAEIYPRG